MICALLSYALKIDLAKSGVDAESREEDDYMGPHYKRDPKPVEKPVEQDFTAIAKAFAGL